MKTGLVGRGDRGRTRLGLLLIVIGALCATAARFDLTFIYKLWPLLVAMLGIGLLGMYVRRRQRGAMLLGTGVYLIGFSALALYCSFTSWSRMLQAWPAFIGLLGIVLVALYLLGGRQRGLLAGGLALISIAIVFFLLATVGPQLWWTVFILLGLSVLIPEYLTCHRSL